MPQFVLDQSGEVTRVGGANPSHFGPVTFASLDAFTQGYVTALFWTEEEQFKEDAAKTDLEGEPGFSDLAPSALASIMADCEAFQRDAADLLALAEEERGYSFQRAGNDFWLTRNGHGAGFWDRDELEPQGEEWEATQIPLDQWTPEIRATRDRLKAESPGMRLDALAKVAGEVWAYVGDDGKIYV